MFINIDDYIMIGEDSLKVAQQAAEANRENAEAIAIEEVSGFLRNRYNVTTIFAAEKTDTSDPRNKQMVMLVCDIALYHLVSSRPAKQGLEIRKERYDNAIKTLTSIQAGKLQPDLPTIVGPDGEEDYNNPIRFGSQPRNYYGPY